MPYRLSVEDLQAFGAAWHDQGVKSADMAAKMGSATGVSSQRQQTAAILALASAVEGLCGNLLTVGSAICQRIEKLEHPLIETFPH